MKLTKEELGLSTAIDRTIETMRALPEYTGRPKWDDILREELESMFNTQAERLAVAERNRDAARENFLTMQQAAAKLLEDCEVYKEEMKRNYERAIFAEARVHSLEAGDAKRLDHIKKLERRIHNQRRSNRDNWKIAEQRAKWLGSPQSRRHYASLLRRHRALQTEADALRVVARNALSEPSP